MDFSLLPITILIFVIGAMMGSFLNVVIYRIPKDESIVFPSSHCQECLKSLKWYHNIPIFSWIFLGGRCAFCNSKISKQYPIIEILSAVLWVLIFRKIGLEWYFPFVAASFTALLALSVIDIKYHAVPDSINFFALFVALIQPDYWTAIVYAVVAAVSLWSLAKIVSVVTKKEAMGSADVIVAGTMAALLGFPNFFVAMFVSAVIAIVPSLLAKDTIVPFVPFLSIGTLSVYLMEARTNQLIEWIAYA